MFKLLKKEDKNLLENSNFAKNAIFYKDMLAFYEAFSLAEKNKDNLPNFCYLPNGELCLEGLCLLMKMYATEFKFETIKLSLEYLKVLYYTIASYAENDEVDREVIVAEFDEFRKASFKYCNNKKAELDDEKHKLLNVEKDIFRGDIKCQNMQQKSKYNKILAAILLILATLGIAGVALLGINYSINSVWFIVAAVADFLGFVLTIGLLASSKRLKNSAFDLAEHNKNLRKKFEPQKQEFLGLQSKYYRIYCERYEYDSWFAELISKFTKTIGFEEILTKSKMYKLLSYNISYDIARLFKSQQREISEIVADIEAIGKSADKNEEFSRIYARILNQDWLYYNAELRYHFLKKFCDASERELNWKLVFNGKKINPFGVNIKALAREDVAFSPNADTKLVSANISDFIKTNYFKAIDDFTFKNGYSIDELKRVKSSYLERFYNKDIFDGMNGVFFTKKDSKKIAAKVEDFERGQKIPTLVNLKLKLIENSTGLGNSDAAVIKSISRAFFGDDMEKFDIKELSEDDIDYPKFSTAETDEVDDAIVYNIAGEKIIGYKVEVE